MRAPKPTRYLRDVEGFEVSAEEVIRRCAPATFKASINRAGKWVPPDSVTVVTPALLYGLCIGMDRQKHYLYLEERSRQEQRAPNNVVQLRPGPREDHTTCYLERRAATTARWLPERLDRPTYRHNEGGEEGRLGYEPTATEFRAGMFGMGEGTGP